jgi:hypothetical protein
MNAAYRTLRFAVCRTSAFRYTRNLPSARTESRCCPSQGYLWTVFRPQSFG